ncbi:MAG: GEVED domain-containing protein [Pirellulales bacterium]|nr:GEVED domain-containing protein [Pirellulales bacterium]
MTGSSLRKRPTAPRRRRRLRVELCEARILLASDLAAATFPGWSAPIVISTNAGDNVDDSPITVNDNVFFDFGWGNFGNTSTGGTYRVEAFLDNVLIAVNSAIPDTLPNSGFFFTDVAVGTLLPGNHTVELRLDTNNEIAEDNEDNNIFSRTFEVQAIGTEDFGDAPSSAQSGFASSYPVTLANNGARHTPLTGFQLGAAIDVEPDGQPSVDADGDDASLLDDEDGVSFAGSPSIGSMTTVEVTLTNTAGVANPYLDAWIDFNRDGDWNDAGELIHSGLISSGTNSISFAVPTFAAAGETFSRFRLHDGTSGLAPTGLAGEGEVEDHRLTLTRPGVWLDQGPHGTINGQLEFGTPPDRRVTGAIHTVLAHPTNPDILYIGSVNGGIWKTTNATASIPDWTTNTDFLDSLSIGAMAFDPTDPSFNTIVAGTARYSSFGGLGGERGPIYRTTNGGNTWTRLPSAGLLTFGENISGIAARGNTIVVTSSGNAGGIFRSTDGGATFTPISDSDFVSPNDNFTDLVVDQSDPTGQRLYAAAESTGGTNTPGGIYRSDNFGVNWVKITGPAIHARQNALLTSSNNIEMSVHPVTGRLYVAVLIGGQPQGVFHTNTGTSVTPIWTEMDVPVLPQGAGVAITGATNATSIEITSNNHGLSSGNFVVVNGVQGNTAANGFFQVTVTGPNTFLLNGSSGNGPYTGGGTWTQVTGPSPTPKTIEETGAQGRIHFSIRVHPIDEDILFIGGDRQDHPNAIGDNTFGGAIFRGDASITRDPTVAPSPQWDHATHDVVALDPNGGTANGTAPHADSREIVFDANGNLIEVDDGGVFRLTSPLDNTGDWFSLAGTLSVVEFHDVAYDSLSNVILGGTQDNGTHIQISEGNQVWDFLQGGDGGDVSIDNVTLAGSNQSIRYTSFQFLNGFTRRVFDQFNNPISVTAPALTLVAGATPIIAGQNTQFKTPVELNAIDPTRMIIGGASNLWESQDQGDTVSNVSSSIGVNRPGAVAYGGISGGVANEDVLYVGSGNDVFVRTAGIGAPSQAASYPGTGSVLDIALDTANWMTSFVIDSNSVYTSNDSGATWTDITGNLMSLAGERLRTIEFIPGSAGALVVGGSLGVFTTLITNLGSWTEVGNNLPNAVVHELIYDETDDVLVAGTLGRGAWTLPNSSLVLAGLPAPNVIPSGTSVNAGAANASGINTLTLEFDQAVTATGNTALRLFNHTTDQLIDLTAASLSGQGTTNLTWDLSGISALLPSGRYTAELLASEVSGLGGNLSATFATELHVLHGDLNGDGVTDAADFAVVGANFDPLPGTPFRDGDADGNGRVEALDFPIVGANFSPLGLAPLPLEFGDAPETGFAFFATTLANDGARHVLSGPRLGAAADAEPDGQPHPTANGDGADGDGISGIALVAGQTSTFNLTATVTGTAALNAWIDFNQDGDWDDFGEQVFDDQPVVNGTQSLTLTVPPNAAIGDVFSRFRISESAGYSHSGLAASGEVEDHLLTITATPTLDGPGGAPGEPAFSPQFVVAQQQFLQEIPPQIATPSPIEHSDAGQENYFDEYGYGVAPPELSSNYTDPASLWDEAIEQYLTGQSEFAEIESYGNEGGGPFNNENDLVSDSRLASMLETLVSESPRDLQTLDEQLTYDNWYY